MLVKTYVDFQQCLDTISKSNIIALDTETTGLNTRKDKVIGIGICNEQLKSFYLPVYQWTGKDLKLVGSIDKLKQALNILHDKKIIAHNSYFDLQVILNNFGIDLWNSLHADTILLKHTVDESHPFGLKPIAAMLFGVNELEEQKRMKESIKKNGGSTNEYFKADTVLIGKYCEQDCKLTMKIYNYYLKLLKEDNLENFYFNKEVMPLYKLVTKTMLDSGVMLDLNYIKSSEKEILNDISSYEDKIQEAIKDYTTVEFKQYYFNKEYPISNKGDFAQALAIVNNLQFPKTRGGKLSINKKTLDQLPKTQIVQFLSGNLTTYIDTDNILKTRDYLFKQSNQKYMFNLSSKHHLKKLFFEYLRETPISTTDKGNPQVDDDFLDVMATKYEWVKDLQIYNKLNKIYGTYIKRFIDEHENGIFYPAWLQHGTTSSRYSGDLQQLPRAIDSNDIVSKYTNRIRNFIIAGSGHKLIDADYSSLEVVVFAHDSRDDKLLNMIRNKEDFYSRIAIDVWDLKDYSALKSAPNFLKKHKPELRQSAKGFSLGIRYGLESFKLHHDLKISQDEADLIIYKYFKSYPRLKIRMDELKEQAIKTGKVIMESGRIRHLPQVKNFVDTYGLENLEALELYKNYASSSDYIPLKELRKKIHSQLNNALNSPIQGMASHIINQAAIQVMKTFKSLNMQSVIVAMIHDEILLRSPVEEVDQASKILQDCMENTIKLLVPLEAEPHVGDKYGEIK